MYQIQTDETQQCFSCSPKSYFFSVGPSLIIKCLSNTSASHQQLVSQKINDPTLEKFPWNLKNTEHYKSYITTIIGWSSNIESRIRKSSNIGFSAPSWSGSHS